MCGGAFAGAGPGPSGMRPDHLRRLVGNKGQKPGAAVVTELCNVLADGRAPRGLRLAPDTDAPGTEVAPRAVPGARSLPHRRAAPLCQPLAGL